jgi:MoxR-like ATPase
MRKPNLEVRSKFLEAVKQFGKDTLSVEDINVICKNLKIKFPQWFTKDPENRAGRGKYFVRGAVVKSAPIESVAMAAQIIPMAKKHISSVETDIEINDIVPKVYKNYVPFGNFDDVLAIIESKVFYPILITGHSGNGKTMSVEQACAKAKRKFICVSMTPDTDEGDLLGNFVLINGEMVWRDGPVTVAARLGAVLCIDEIDYGSQNLSTLQRVLEGKPFLLKKKNEIVYPTEGFTIVATANTKGKGSEDGRYMFTNILNEAFLERFLNTMEQTWPPVAIEKKIITKELESVGKGDSEFAEKLVSWADVIRKTFEEDAADEVISTRRLVHIVKTYGVFGDKKKAIQLCLNRFNEDTKVSFLDLYTKIDSGVDAAQPDASTKPAAGEIAF